MKNTVNIITTIIFLMKLSRYDCTPETKFSIQTRMKLLELAYKELDRSLDRNITSELKRHFNSIDVILERVQNI